MFCKRIASLHPKQMLKLVEMKKLFAFFILKYSYEWLKLIYLLDFLLNIATMFLSSEVINEK